MDTRVGWMPRPGNGTARALWRSFLLAPLLLLCCQHELSLAVESDQHVSEAAHNHEGERDTYATSDASQGSKLYPTTCYEGDERHFPIISRAGWMGLVVPIKRSAPVEYFVVRDAGGDRCRTHADCVRAIKSLRHKAYPRGPCSTSENFYVGDDGHVYEGRGWDVEPYWHLNGLRGKAATVQFLGSHESDGPTEEAVDAFIRMVKVGEWMGKVSVDYRVVSMGQVYNDSGLVGDALESVVKGWKRWKNDVDTLSTWEILPPRTLKLVLREAWGAVEPTWLQQKIEFPVEYVMILEGGERCYTKGECISRIQREQLSLRPRYGDLFENFYVGEDGNVYEGRGFDTISMWHVRGMKNKYLTVRIFGNFKEDHPSLDAITALKLLVNTGVWMGKISPEYKLYSFRGIYDHDGFLGDGFLRYAEKWTPWAHHLDNMSLQERERLGFTPLLRRNDWNATEQTTTHDIMHPVDHVVIMVQPNHRRCFKLSNCTALVQEMQTRGDFRENFYIGDEGNVYEGRGWDIEQQEQIRYFNQSYISIRFLGPHQNEGLSLPAIYAFEGIVQLGIKMGKISRDYQLYSFRHIYDGGNYMGKEVDEYFQKSERWNKFLDSFSEEERLSRGLLPLMLREEWTAEGSNKTFHQFDGPIKYVIIGDTQEKRCFTTPDCIYEMQAEELRGIEMYGDIADNFYIGNDGTAYEGRGWNNASSLFIPGVSKEFIHVSFFGDLRGHPPSSIAALAFFRLMEHGVKTGKLLSNFKVVTLYQLVDSKSSGSFQEDIQNWNHWTDDLQFFFDVERSPSGLLFVDREDWQAEHPIRALELPRSPLKYILVRDVGDHCENLQECISVVKGLQGRIDFRHWDVDDNYYIGGDGHIYEGRGGDRASFWHTKGIENNFISVGFLGSFQSSEPSRKSVEVFRFLTVLFVRLHRLAPDYKIVSLGHVFNNDSMVGGKLIEELAKHERWSEETTLSYDRTRLRSWREPIVLREEWLRSGANTRTVNRLRHPLKYVMVRDGGEACDTYLACLGLVRRGHDSGADNETSGISENFYVGDDGFVYEGIGWDWDMGWNIPSRDVSVSVQFFGKHDKNLPSPQAIDAFKNVILKGGVEAGKLDPNYEIVLMPLNIATNIGERLKAEVPSWNSKTQGSN